MSAVAGTLSRRFTLYVAIQAVSVLVPGLVMIAEIGILVISLRHSAGVLSYVAGQTAGLNGMLSLLLTIITLAIAFVTGYLVREAAFKLLGLIERSARGARLDVTELHHRLTMMFGQKAVDECLAAQPVLKRLLVQRDTEPSVAAIRVSGGHIDGPGYQAFVYSKMWPRTYAPVLGVDRFEVEINMLAATLGPVTLLVVDALVLARPLWWLSVLLAMVGAGMLALVVKSLLRLRQTERVDSLRNLVQNFVMRQAAARYPGENTENSAVEVD